MIALQVAAIIVAAMAAVSGCSSGTTGAAPWRLQWSDAFSGPAGSGINKANWKFDTGHGVFGTGEVETMTSARSNVRLDGRGDLDLTALETGAAGSTAAWTSGRLQSRRLFGAPAGGEMMVTASIRQPDPAQGTGYWPGFWMLGPNPKTWPKTGEVDILEDVNGLSDNSGTLHCGNLTQRNADGTDGPCHEGTGLGSGLVACADCQSQFHTYSVVIDRLIAGQEQIRWYLNGREYYSLSESKVGEAVWTAAVDHKFSILLSLAIGGSFPNTQCRCTSPISATSPEGTMVIRNVSVYVTSQPK